MADGHIWMRHLQPDRIIRVIDHNQSPAAVEDLIVNYLGVADTPRLALVAAAEGFADTSRLLQQFRHVTSVYPHAEVQANEFAGQQETILSERVIGEQVIGEQVNGEQVSGNLAIDGPMLNAPTLAPPVQPADEVVTEEIGPREPAADQPRHSVAKPSLDDLPEPDDIELLPAPKADARVASCKALLSNILPAVAPTVRLEWTYRWVPSERSSDKLPHARSRSSLSRNVLPCKGSLS